MAICPYAYDDAQSVWNPATGTMYTRGTHYTQTDSGGTITWTNIGGMAPSVVILLRVPRASGSPGSGIAGSGRRPSVRNQVSPRCRPRQPP